MHRTIIAKVKLVGALEPTRIMIAIAGKSYPVVANPEEELVLRSIEKELNEKIEGMLKEYAQIDKTDCLSMTLLSYAAELYQVKRQKDQSSETDRFLSEIESILDFADIDK